VLAAAGLPEVRQVSEGKLTRQTAPREVVATAGSDPIPVLGKTRTLRRSNRVTPVIDLLGACVVGSGGRGARLARFELDLCRF